MINKLCNNEIVINFFFDILDLICGDKFKVKAIHSEHYVELYIILFKYGK